MRSPETIQFFVWITELGISRVFIPLCLIVSFMLYIANRKWLIIPFATSVLGSMVITLSAKLFFQRSRPLDGILLEQSYSFPSGHATIAISLYGFLIYLLVQSTLSWKWKLKLTWVSLGSLLILAIGSSRLILGVHYLSDVLVGYMVGVIWLIIGIYISERLAAKGKFNFKKPLASRDRIVIASLIISTILSYGIFAALYQPPYA